MRIQDQNVREFLDSCEICCLVFDGDTVRFQLQLGRTCVHLATIPTMAGMSFILRELGMEAANPQSRLNWYHAACASKFVRDAYSQHGVRNVA